MSLRPIRLAVGLLVTSLAFGVAPAAPALADGMITPPARHHVRHHVRHHKWHAPRVVEHVRIVREIVYVPQPVYATTCGGCGTYVAYAPALRPTPIYYTTSYSHSCSGCGYVGAGYIGLRFRHAAWVTSRVAYHRGFYGRFH